MKKYFSVSPNIDNLCETYLKYKTAFQPTIEIFFETWEFVYLHIFIWI